MHFSISLMCFLFTCSFFQVTGQINEKKPIKSKINSVKTVETIEIDSVWAANKVSFSLTTVGKKQFICYYNKDRMMTIASRNIDENKWQKTILPTKLAWDSHNYVTMGFDELGYIHVSGNMHVNPLVYYRSTLPYDISNMQAINKMVSKEEDRITYPKFINDKEGHLLYSYRTGSSGNGNVLINKFNTSTKTWSRYLSSPFFEGMNGDKSRSAYHNLTKDDEGNFHCIWLWRSTPLVETSHQLCYATSPDLLNWKNAAGEAVSLPFKPDNEKLIVDNAPEKGGMHNGRIQILITPAKNPLIGYIKYDKNGNTQFYIAGFLNNKWVSKQISNWDFSWKFSGGGDQMSIGGDFNMSGFSDDGFLQVSWNTEKGNSGNYVIDPKSLISVNNSIKLKPRYPKSMYDKISTHPKLLVSIATDNGQPLQKNTNYVLKWETMPKSHGSHAPEIIPERPMSPLLLLKNTIYEQKIK